MSANLDDLTPGDTVNIKDTSNDRVLTGAVRRCYKTGGFEVYVIRFKNTMFFSAKGTTPLGRFVLLGRKA